MLQHTQQYPEIGRRNATAHSKECLHAIAQQCTSAHRSIRMMPCIFDPLPRQINQRGEIGNERKDSLIDPDIQIFIVCSIDQCRDMRLIKCTVSLESLSP